MKRHASGSATTVALFPFLAVLICTMGALIVLLVLLVQQARVDAYAQQAVDAAPSTAEQEELEDAQWRARVLTQSRAEKTEELAAVRAKLAHLEEHTQRLKAEAESLLAQARAIDEGRTLRDDELAAARAELAQWQEKIAHAQRELAEKRRQLEEKSRSYALIPYEGPLGTRRRPIYVECTELGVILQPEGILLRAEDFQGPLGPGNPLEVALRAVREHLERTQGNQAGQPYPLLVVRPGGVLAYAAARAAMKSWDDEFGYELVGDDLKLDFGPPDPALHRIVQQTVAEARRRQATLAAMMPRRYTREDPPPPAPASPPSAAPSPAASGGTGLGSAGGMPQATFPAAATAAGWPSAASPGGTRQPAATEGALPGMHGSSTNASGGVQPASKAGQPLDAPGGNAAPGEGSTSLAGRGAGPGGSTAAMSSQPAGRDATGTTGATGSPAPFAQPSSAGGTTTPVAASAGAGGGAAWGQASPSGPNMQLQFGPSRPSATAQETAASSGGSAGRAPAGKRPNWALPTAKPHAIGVTRPIPLAIQADRLTLLPSRGEQRVAHEIAVHPELTEEDVQRLVAAVQREVEGWGLAVADGYWKPLLVAEVAPDAEAQFARLRTALQGSGLELVRKTR
jgi:hypothetical protein